MDISLLISPKGRIARGPFWLGFLIIMGVSALTNAVPIAGQIVGLVLIWPQVVIHVKRLHDFGWSGWLLLLPFSVSALCTGMLMLNGGTPLLTATPDKLPALVMSPAMHLPLIYLEVAFAVEFVFLLWVGLTKGDAQANRFGPAPMRER
jgi:uncharacterized membrane protein YhaH (DUF805 family)